MRRALGTATTIFFLLTQTLLAAPVKFLATSRDGKNVIKFVSKAPLETIEGVTSRIEGNLDVDLANPTAATGQFEVDLTTLKTGIDMRDQHLRERFVHTDSFPKATFRLTKVAKLAAPALADGQPINVEAQGKMTIHGVTKPVMATGTVTYMKESEETQVRLPGDLLHVDVAIPILLSDFGIERPKMLFMKLSDNVTIGVDVFASTKQPEPREPRPEPKKQ